MNSVEGTSCSHSQGRPSVRVTMSAHTVSEKPNSTSPQTIIRTISSGSSARHFRWRCRPSTSLSATLTSCRVPWSRRSVDRPDQALDLVGVRAELLRQLVEVGIGDLLEPRLVGRNYFDPDRLDLRQRLVLQLERLLRFHRADFSSGGEHPFLLVGIE